MFKKIFAVVLAAFFAAGCATFGQKKDFSSLVNEREVPVFFAGGDSVAAFQLVLSARDFSVYGVAIIKKIDSKTFSIKVMGPMGTNMVDAVSEEGKVKYNYILPDINSSAIKNRFERFINAILVPPGEIKNVKVLKDSVMEVKRKTTDGNASYFYNEFAKYPARMHSGSVKLEFLDYQPYQERSLPYNLRYQDTFAEISLNLTLVSIR